MSSASPLRAGFLLWSTLFVLLCAAGVSARPALPLPVKYVDFDYYTFALTWQPGICSVNDASLIGTPEPESCAADQAHAPLIGVHGLWPSRPQALIKASVRVQRWWSRGCDLLNHSDEAPALGADLQARLAAVMPQLQTSLLTHEYDKHLQCFGFDPTLIFTRELAMRQAVSDTPLGRFLTDHTGQTVAHDDVVTAFEQGFRTTDARAIQLQCVRDGTGREVLTQLWFTVRAKGLAAFPAAASLTHLPINQDTCPSTFLVPSW